MRFFVLLLMAAAVLAPAQTTRKRTTSKPAPKAQPAPAATSWPLVALRVDGNRMYSESAIISASGLRIGQGVTKQDFEKARDRLVATGAFETVGFEFGPDQGGKGYQGKFEVAEIQQVYPYRFEELPGSDAELRAYLKSKQPLFGDRIPGTREVLGRFTEDLNEYAASRGLKHKVIGRVTADKPGELIVVFRPNTPAPVIAEVRFTGNQAVTGAALHNALAAVAVGTPYSEARVRELLDTSIRPLYDAKGRLHVSFPKVEVKPAGGGVQGLSVSVSVDEGPEYKFGKVAVAGSQISADELQKLVTVKPETPANFDAVKATQEVLKKRYQKAGYMDMTSTVDRRIDEKSKTVDVTIRTDPGPQYKMGKLNMQGLDVVGEPAVRKLWGMKEGAPFDAAYPQVFLDRVREEGYFDNLGKTRFTTDVHSQDRTVDVTLYFAGAAENAQKKSRREQP